MIEVGLKEKARNALREKKSAGGFTCYFPKLLLRITKPRFFYNLRKYEKEILLFTTKKKKKKGKSSLKIKRIRLKKNFLTWFISRSILILSFLAEILKPWSKILGKEIIGIVLKFCVENFLGGKVKIVLVKGSLRFVSNDTDDIKVEYRSASLC